MDETPVAPSLTRYIAFTRTAGHCYIAIICAQSLRHAMEIIAINDDCKILTPSGAIRDDCDMVFDHPLAYIESRFKADMEFDELQSSTKGHCTVGSSWDIGELPNSTLNSEFADAFVTMNETDSYQYYKHCRKKFRKKHPHSRARAFVWHLKTGALVTFHRRPKGKIDEPLKILGRYLLRWPKEQRDYLDYRASDVEEWHGDYDDILEQMSVQRPIRE